MTLTGSGGGNINTGGNAVTFSGALSGSGGLNVLGGGTLTLAGSNTYSGGTTISGSSTLALNNAYALPNSTLTVSASNELPGLQYQRRRDRRRSTWAGWPAAAAAVLPTAQQPGKLSGHAQRRRQRGQHDVQRRAQRLGRPDQDRQRNPGPLRQQHLHGHHDRSPAADSSSISASRQHRQANIINNAAIRLFLGLGRRHPGNPRRAARPTRQLFNGLTVNPGASAIVLSGHVEPAAA